MRESRLSGSEGGVPGNGHPYPYPSFPLALWTAARRPSQPRLFVRFHLRTTVGRVAVPGDQSANCENDTALRRTRVLANSLDSADRNVVR
jgi:hypothetical protein